MYRSPGNLTLGFHGCDRAIGEAILAGTRELKPSQNLYDWLGSGQYFWEGNPSRAIGFARHLKDRPARKSASQVKDPFVIGAVIHLGNCLNLLDTDGLQLVREGFLTLQDAYLSQGKVLPENKPADGSDDLLLRYLDRAVIETIHEMVEQAGASPFDSVRGAFWEGEPLYPNAGFRKQNHIQLCIRNPNCIKGYFRVRDPDDGWPLPG